MTNREKGRRWVHYERLYAGKATQTGGEGEVRTQELKEGKYGSFRRDKPRRSYRLAI